MEPHSLTLLQARQAWRTRQHLDGAKGLSLPALVTAVGGIPVPTGASTILALFARGGLAQRETLDSALFRERSLAIVPGPRGLAWLVESSLAPAMRAFAVADHAAREARVAASCELSSRDLVVTRDALRTALGKPRPATDLFASLPAAAQRSLGEGGRRAGCTTLAALVLRGMWSVGEIEREPVDGRIDSPHWRFRLEAMPKVVPPGTEALPRLAAHWIRAHAPVSAKAFAAAFGVANSRASAALKALHLRPATLVETGEHLLVPEDFHATTGVSTTTADFLPVRDPLVDAHPELHGLCEAAQVRHVMTRSGTPASFVLVDGTVGGIWFWDPSAARVRITPLFPWTPAQQHAVDTRAAALTHFLATNLPDPALHLATPLRAPSRRAVRNELEL